MLAGFQSGDDRTGVVHGRREVDEDVHRVVGVELLGVAPCRDVVLYGGLFGAGHVDVTDADDPQFRIAGQAGQVPAEDVAAAQDADAVRVLDHAVGSSGERWTYG